MGNRLHGWSDCMLKKEREREREEDKEKDQKDGEKNQIKEKEWSQ